MTIEIALPPYRRERERARRLFDAGRYEAVVDICDKLIPPLLASGSPDALALSRLLLNDKSRVLRSMGRVQDALLCYVEALKSAHYSGNIQDETWQLVQFGKIFGKYLERQTLFSACLREAARRYENFLKEMDPAPPSLVVRFAIVQDLLGSYYRRLGERDPVARLKCEEAYLQSLHYHKSTENIEGASRALCHLAYARGLFAHLDPLLSEDERIKGLREALQQFETGIRVVLRLPAALRGRATRRAQQAHLHLLLGNIDYARRLLAEALASADERKDPRATVVVRRILAMTFVANGEPSEAIHNLEQARSVAQDMKFSGFERRILADMAEIHLKTDEPQQAIEVLQQNDHLVMRELLEFDSGFSDALDIFRAVAPDRAERYLREGQRQDYESLVRELVDNGRLIRTVMARYERSRSVGLQLAVHRFAKVSVQHTLKNELNSVALSISRVREAVRQVSKAKARFSDLFESADDAIARIKQLLGDDGAEDRFERASFKDELEFALKSAFDPSRIRLEFVHNLIFPALMPGLMWEAFRHLVENARAATDEAAPESLEVPLMHVRHEVDRQGGSKIYLMNPGSNPKVMPVTHPISSIAHGFANASWFFKEVLGFDLWFELREDGPRTFPFLCNCVVIAVPPTGASPSLYRIEPIVHKLL